MWKDISSEVQRLRLGFERVLKAPRTYESFRVLEIQEYCLSTENAKV